MSRLPLVFHPIYSQLQLTKNHRFPIEKYQALHDLATQAYPTQTAIYTVQNLISFDQLNKVHETNYINEFISGQIDEKAMKRIGFPWSEQFVKRTRTAVAGTLLAANLAVEHGVAINLTGGYHHAHPNFGSGFCVFNDLVIAATELLDNGEASRILIFDCDVHQGDGTATCAQHNPNIFTCSIHCEKNFPVRKQTSDWDLGLDRQLTDQEYLSQVQQTLKSTLHSFKPDFIFYDAGIDIHQNDDLGLLSITTEGVRARDKLIFDTAKHFDIPVAAVIGGGYQRNIVALSQVHLQLIHAAIDCYYSD